VGSWLRIDYPGTAAPRNRFIWVGGATRLVDLNLRGITMEWSNEARDFLQSRREKLPGDAAEIDKAIDRIRKDSEKAAEIAESEVVEKDHVKQAIAGLPEMEVVSEGSEGSFGFVKAIAILGVIFLVVGLYTELWYQDKVKYGEQPEGDEEVFMLRWMLWVGIIMLVIAGIVFVIGRRQAEEEWEEELPAEKELPAEE